jgi:hypothetical protein
MGSEFGKCLNTGKKALARSQDCSVGAVDKIRTIPEILDPTCGSCPRFRK